MHSPQQLVILGFPWLLTHNPQINWGMGSILQCSQYCNAVWLSSALSPVPTTTHPAEFPDFSGVPPEYMPLKEVFNKARTLLPAP